MCNFSLTWRTCGISVDSWLTPRNTFEHKVFRLVGSLMAVAASENGVNVLTHLGVLEFMSHFEGSRIFRGLLSRQRAEDYSVNDCNKLRLEVGRNNSRLAVAMMLMSVQRQFQFPL